MRLMILAALAFATLALAGCGSGSDRISFAGEGDRCSDSQVLYVDNSGDELFCEGFEYKGPLTRDEKRETLRLASRLASDGSLSGEDKKRVRKFAENPPALARTHLVPRTILAAGGKVLVLGQAEDASFHIAEIDPASSEVTTSALSLKNVAGLAVVGRTAWLYGTGIWSPRTPVWQIDLATPERVRELSVFDEGSASVSAIASDGDSLWIGLSIVGEEGVSSARVERFDLRSGRVTSSADLPGESIVPSIAIGAGAVWVEAERSWKLDPETAQAKSVAFAVPVGPIRIDTGAVWALGGSDPASPRLFRIDPAKGKVVTRTAVSGDIVEFELGAGGVWLLRETGELERVDAKTNRLETVASLDLGPVAALHSVDGAAGRSLAVTDEAAWVTLSSSGELARIDAATGKVTILQLSVEYELAE